MKLEEEDEKEILNNFQALFHLQVEAPHEKKRISKLFCEQQKNQVEVEDDEQNNTLPTHSLTSESDRSVNHRRANL